MKNHNKYTPISTRHEIGLVFYPKRKVPANGITKRYANNPENAKMYEAVDLGVYCLNNNITGTMLKQIDGEILKMLIGLSDYMRDKLCSQEGIPPELIDKFNSFLEFEKIKEQMEKR